MNSLEILTNEQNLYRAFRKSLNKRSYTFTGKKFAVDPLPKLYELQQELLNKTYEISPYTHFVVTSPKEREILACTFRDKIVQHVLCDEILSKELPNICIQDNYAGQKGKGSKYAKDRLKEQLLEFNSNHKDGYVYKGDIHKFYYSIDHEVAKDIMHKHFPEDIHWLIDKFIDSTENPGIALGNQINTIVSTLYLNELDQYIKNTLKIQYYGRYADDFFIIEESKEDLRKHVKLIIEFLNNKLLLKINPKSQIIHLKNGVNFIGFNFRIQNGVVQTKIINKKERTHRRKFNKMVKLVKKDLIPLQNLKVSEEGWEAHAKYSSDIDLSYYKNKMKEIG